jgi:hypothetical protein
MSSNIPKEKEPWYAVRSLLFDKQGGHYEERTVLFNASSPEEAIKLAEEEVAQYCEDLESVESAGYLDTFHIFGSEIGSGTEIFSLIRTTDMDRDEYIDRFLDSGLEHRTDFEDLTNK